MITIFWSTAALADLDRVHSFLAAVNRKAADGAIRKLTQAPAILREHPRIGRRVAMFETREVRRIIVGDYELRYELADDCATVLRVWHGRELR